MVAPRYDDSCTIVIEGADARVEGFIPWATVVDVTSYYAPGYRFSTRYKNKVWDGRIKLSRKRKQTFPAGLLHLVKPALEEDGIKVRIDDHRRPPPASGLGDDWWQTHPLAGVKFDYPYDYQPSAAADLIKAGRGIAAMATNSGKTEVACLVAQKLLLPTLFLVPGKDLLHQTYKRFCNRLGFSGSDKDVGRIGDGLWQPGEWITVATVASLHHHRTKEKCQKLLDQTDLLFIDECHRTGANTWYEVVRMCNAYYRFGLSGTPLKRTDGADLRLIGVTGPVIVEIRNKFLIEVGVSVPVDIEFLRIEKPKNLHPKMHYKDVYKVGIVENPFRDRRFVSRINHYVEEGRNALVLVEEIAHGHNMDKALWTAPKGSFTPHQFISGQESSAVREKALKDFARGELRVLIATRILNEGVDVPNIDVIALLGGLKSSIASLQKIGRGMRKGGYGQLIVIDSMDFTHRYLLEHSLQRLRDYRAEECFGIREVK